VRNWVVRALRTHFMCEPFFHSSHSTFMFAELLDLLVARSRIFAVSRPCPNCAGSGGPSRLPALNAPLGRRR
jgi:hypothetical protein